MLRVTPLDAAELNRLENYRALHSDARFAVNLPVWSELTPDEVKFRGGLKAKPAPPRRAPDHESAGKAEGTTAGPTPATAGSSPVSLLGVSATPSSMSTGASGFGAASQCV